MKLRSMMLGVAASVAVPCVAQQVAGSQQIDRPTADVLGSAIDALAREQYADVRSLVGTLDPESLSAFERSRVEQLLFNAASTLRTTSSVTTKRASTFNVPSLPAALTSKKWLRHATSARRY